MTRRKLLLARRTRRAVAALMWTSATVWLATLLLPDFGGLTAVLGQFAMTCAIFTTGWVLGVEYLDNNWRPVRGEQARDLVEAAFYAHGPLRGVVPAAQWRDAAAVAVTALHLDDDAGDAP